MLHSKSAYNSSSLCYKLKLDRITGASLSILSTLLTAVKYTLIHTGTKKLSTHCSLHQRQLGPNLKFNYQWQSFLVKSLGPKYFHPLSWIIEPFWNIWNWEYLTIQGQVLMHLRKPFSSRIQFFTVYYIMKTYLFVFPLHCSLQQIFFSNLGLVQNPAAATALHLFSYFSGDSLCIILSSPRNIFQLNIAKKLQIVYFFRVAPEGPTSMI